MNAANKDFSSQKDFSSKSGSTSSDAASSAAALNSAQNALIIRYERIKRMARIGILLLFLAGISYVLLMAFSEHDTRPVTDDARLGKNILFFGSSIIISSVRDGRQEILVSNDNGVRFQRSADSWPLHDSGISMSLSGDSTALVILESNGTLHISRNINQNFETANLKLNAKESAYGIISVPGTDSVFIYGSFPGVFELSLKNPGNQQFIRAPDSSRVLSMGINREKYCMALLWKGYGYRPQIYGGHGFTSLIRMFPGLPEPNKGFTIDTPDMRFQLEYSLGLVPGTNVWYHIFLRYSYSSGVFLEYLYPDNTDTPRTYHTRFNDFDNAMIDTVGRNPVFYGYTPVIEHNYRLDTIPYATYILDLGLTGHAPDRALISNSDVRYLFQKKVGVWSLNPVLVEHPPSPAIKRWLVVFGIALIIATTILISMGFSTQQKIKKLIEDEKILNALLTKSEKPLGLAGEDLLGFAALEKAVKLIIRNPQLELPTTIVISGSWGSGKSSMMNRIRETLETDPELKKRFMTTWFNAWHLQGESSLLNSFLLNIIDCYERYYAFYSAFRLKIAASRYNRLPFWKKFGFGFAVAVLFPFFLLVGIKILHIDRPKDFSWINDYCTTLRNIFFSSLGGTTPSILTPIGAGVLIICSLLFMNRQFVPTGLSAFFQLIPKNNFRLDVEAEEIGSREKFRKQYWEIMEAGRRDRRMVVFIDDLDRISGDKILELLEGINFISDVASKPPGTGMVSPNTIFVLGMYTQEVARLVGTQLIKINNSDLPAVTLGSLYIEKMVQLIVPVPFDTNNKEKLKKLYEN
jgi:hypothetical protein